MFVLRIAIAHCSLDEMKIHASFFKVINELFEQMSGQE